MIVPSPLFRLLGNLRGSSKVDDATVPLIRSVATNMGFPRGAIIFALALFGNVAFTPQGAFNPQHVSRLGLTLAIIEGRVDIDRLADRTIDKSEFGGHFYSDKLPGLSLLAVPSVAATRLVLETTGRNADPADPEVFTTYLTIAVISTVALAGAAAAAVLYLLCVSLGASTAGAMFAATALAVGTPFFGWSTAFFSHAVSGAILLFAIFLVVSTQGIKEPRRSRAGVGIGLLLGYLLVVDLTAVIPAGLVGLLFILGGASTWPLRVRQFARLAFGEIVGLLPLPIYNWIAFGSPFRLGYSQVVGFVGMKEGLFGISLPNPATAWQLLAGSYRGLLPLSPVLVLVPVGLLLMLRVAERRGVGLVILGTIMNFVAINAGYYYWQGGWSTGPRHLVAMLPLAAVALAFAWPKPLALRAASLVLLAISVAISGICASTDMFTPDVPRDTFFEYILPRFMTSERWRTAWPLLIVWMSFASLAFQPSRPRQEPEKHLA